MVEQTFGSGPVDEKYVAKMRAVAAVIDEFLNGEERPKHTGFVLLVFPFEGHEGRANYMSNAMREDVVRLLREQLRYFEGAPDDVSGRA